MQESLAVDPVDLQFYKPHYQFQIETEKYHLKIANHFHQLNELFRFRQQVFHGDQGNKLLDFDVFDSHCDHILVIDKQTNSICGTYRLALSNKVSSHYSQTEFELDQFLALPGVKMELGRAAISAHHRNGQVLDLLWRGLAEYAKLSKADFLFGCSSVMTTNKRDTLQIFKDLQSKNHLVFEYGIQPTLKYQFDFENPQRESMGTHFSEIPPLLLSYLNAGSKVYGHPALDKDFGCIDFLTILDLKNLTRFYKKRYFRDAT